MSIASRLSYLAVAAAATVFAATPSWAYTVYKLKKDYYAIVCEDGTIHSYSGGPGGIGIVGAALCEGHGGIADPNGTGTIVMKVQLATVEMRRFMRKCEKDGTELDDIGGVTLCVRGWDPVTKKDARGSSDDGSGADDSDHKD